MLRTLDDTPTDSEYAPVFHKRNNLASMAAIDIDMAERYHYRIIQVYIFKMYWIVKSITSTNVISMYIDRYV